MGWPYDGTMIVDGGYSEHVTFSAEARETVLKGEDDYMRKLTEDRIEYGTEDDDALVLKSIFSGAPQGYSRPARRFTGRWGKKRSLQDMLLALTEEDPQDDVSDTPELPLAPGRWPSAWRAWRNRTRPRGRALIRSVARTTLCTAAPLSSVGLSLLQLKGQSGVYRRRSSATNRRQG